MDSSGRECVAFGKGIGFIKPPYKVPLNQIERTFYSDNHIEYEGIKNIPENIIRLAIRIVDEVEKNLSVTLMSMTALALADHIQFALQRINDHIELKLPIREDIKQLYPRELHEAEKALKMIEDELEIHLDLKEATMLAMHFINSQVGGFSRNEDINRKLLEACVVIIETEYNLKINRESFNYSRFATHVDYLIRRVSTDDQIKSANISMYETLKKEYFSAYKCALKISKLFEQYLDNLLSKEELLYLMLHINRLCEREQVDI